MGETPFGAPSSADERRPSWVIRSSVAARAERLGTRLERSDFEAFAGRSCSAAVELLKPGALFVNVVDLTGHGVF
jgi:hypothetical protein